ncbi:unnamed protein product [Pipistrellus nathusii]|uniref:Uncharacterized protein n=1 Tax=Pipistrellus nathusii TaxID=59473 RepID=A0ABN9ZCZ7_PIPNA
MGVDNRHNEDRKGRRREPKSQDMYLRPWSSGTGFRPEEQLRCPPSGAQGAAHESHQPAAAALSRMTRRMKRPGRRANRRGWRDDR